jgi:hypothetical protein
MILASAAAILIVGGPVQAQTPLGSAFTYQGRLELSGVAMNGRGAADLRFTLYDGADGSAAQVGNPITVNHANFSDGLFTVELDFGFNAFVGDERFLQIEAAAPAGTAFVTLSPRQRLTAAPHATVATMALAVPGVDGYSLDSPAGSEDVVSVNENDDVSIGRHTVLTPPLAEQENLGPYTYSQVPGAWQSFTAGQTGTLRTIHVFLAAPFDGDSILLRLHSGTGTGGAFLDSSSVDLSTNPSFVAFAMHDVSIVAGSTYTWSLIGSAALVGVSTSPNPYPGGMSNLGANTDLAFATVATWETEMPSLFVAGNSRVGIGTDAPAYRLDVADRVRVREGSAGTAGIHFYQATAAEDRGFVGMSSDDHIGLWGSEGAGWGLLMNVANGRVGIGTSDPQARLEVAGPIRSTAGGFQFPDGSIQTSAADSGAWEADGSGNISYGSGNVSIGTTISNGKLYINTGPNSSERSIVCEHNGSNFVVRPSSGGSPDTVIENTAGELMLNPGRVTSVAALKIYGGADIAEPFDTSDGAAIEPGVLVSIDPSAPGKLRVATHAYDRRVAGIVSGAGGVDTGVLLRQKETLADGAHPVALNGRVYCYADADAGGPIEPGDLLTTSDTPGHAMKASDRERAPGATVGKAMTALERGRGLVLVLVSLQ